jgi:hypothetical protein
MLAIRPTNLWFRTLCGLSIIGVIYSQDLFGFDGYCDLQFFGDFFISETAIREINTLYGQSQPLDNTKSLLKTCHKNIVNFEGVATSHEIPLETKDYLLKMPIWIPRVLMENGITAITLANNHSMDYGIFGLRDTLTQATLYGLKTVGAHEIPDKVLEPIRLIVGESNHSICIGAFSSTYPDTFWADRSRGGTAYASLSNIKKTFKKCHISDYKIALFHWGEERSPTPHNLQKSLAEFSINLGFDLIIGHHPHVIQPLALYNGKPIFYSLGNYAFATRPQKSISEGLSLRLYYTGKNIHPNITVVPLNVKNDMVHFNPRGFLKEEKSDAEKNLRHLLSMITIKDWEKHLFFYDKWGWSFHLNFSQLSENKSNELPDKRLEFLPSTILR